MRNHKVVLFLFVTAAILLQACAPDTQGAIATALFETQQISALQTAAAGGGQPSSGQPGVPSDTPQPSNTPTITLTETPSVPYVSVSDDTNCRTGPGVSYGFVTLVKAGQQSEVVNVYNNDYVVIKNPNASGVCWLWLNFANTHDFSAYNLPHATQPPTSTPTFTSTPEIVWEGDWSIWFGPPPYIACSMHVTRSNNKLNGTYNCGSFTGTIHGTLSADFKTVSGSWDNDVPQSGTFQWSSKKNVNQFIGSYGLTGSTYDWCGARNGASMPTPCLWP